MITFYVISYAICVRIKYNKTRGQLFLCNSDRLSPSAFNKFDLI